MRLKDLFWCNSKMDYKNLILKLVKNSFNIMNKKDLEKDIEEYVIKWYKLDKKNLLMQLENLYF